MTTVMILMGMIGNSQAFSRYFDIGVNGMQSRLYTKYENTTRKSLGVELGIPITYFLEVSLSHMFTQENTVYNAAYRQLAQSQGYILPSGNLERIVQTEDTSANGVLGYSFGFLKPAIFAGIVWREICGEDTFEDYGCNTLKPTWNAGVSLSFLLTAQLRFKASYRISPSGYENNTTWDDSTSVGLNWSL